VNHKPCIVITDFNKNYATIWFALIHELHHVLYDLETIEKSRYHLSGEPDLFLIQEDKANDFAREYLFSEDKLRNIEAFIHNPIIVSKKAKEYNIHPSIIYSMFQYWKKEQGENYWGAFKKGFPDISKATAKLNYSNWTAESISETAQQIKSLLIV
jgi:Zn-dependent peptidase ImmA (M78 family)